MRFLPIRSSASFINEATRILFVLIHLFANSSSLSYASDTIDTSFCPKTPKDWDGWRTKILNASPLGSLEPMIMFEDTIRYCLKSKNFNEFDAEEIPYCAKNLFAFFRSQRAMGMLESSDPDFSIFNISSKDYYDSKRLPFSGMIDPPEKFAEHYKTVIDTFIKHNFDKNKSQQIEALRVPIEKMEKDVKNLNVFYYHSPVLDDNILIFVITGQNYDQWYHYEGHDNSALMAVIQKRDRDGKPLSKPKAFFEPRDFNLPHQNFLPGRCVGCHRTGAMPIVPKGGTRVVSFQRTIPSNQAQAWINKRVQDTATAIPDSADMSLLGPRMGEIDPPYRTEEGISQCSKRALGKELAIESVRKVKEAMNCASCHNGNVAGELTYPIGSSHENPHEVMKKFILLGHMPQNVSLSPRERTALFACLQDEYYGGLRYSDSKNLGVLGRSLLRGKCEPPGKGEIPEFTDPAMSEPQNLSPKYHSLSVSNSYFDGSDCNNFSEFPLFSLAYQPILNRAVLEDESSCSEADINNTIRYSYDSVKDIFQNKCAACHSDQAKLPKYSLAFILGKYDPIKWDMDHARRAFTMKDGTYPFKSSVSQDASALFRAIASDTRSASMPIWSYRAVHRNSSLTTAEQLAIETWTAQSIALRHCLYGSKKQDPKDLPGRANELLHSKCVICHSSGGSGSSKALINGLEDLQKSPLLLCKSIHQIESLNMPKGGSTPEDATADSATLLNWAKSIHVDCEVQQ